MCEIPGDRLEARLLAELRSHGGLGAFAAYDVLRGEGACLSHFCDAVRALARGFRVFSSDPSHPITPEIGAVKILELGLEAGVDPHDGAPGSRVRRFPEGISVDFDHPLGKGSAGIVYRGEDLRSGVPLAVKILSLRTPMPAEIRDWFLERFRQEPRLLSRLDHPHIVKVIAHGESEDGPWYAMELLEGGTLADRIRKERRLPPEEVRTYFRALADALAETSRGGILHRDVKPSNIFNRGIKLADFGVAKVPSASRAAGGVRSITEAGAMIGTLPYVAPERLTFSSADLRADVYSLGATMYHAATGSLIFDLASDDRLRWAERHLHGEPRLVGDRVPGFPKPLAEVIGKCLRKSPEERYPSFEALLEALGR